MQLTAKITGKLMAIASGIVKLQFEKHINACATYSTISTKWEINSAWTYELFNTACVRGQWSRWKEVQSYFLGEGNEANRKANRKVQ